MVFLLLEGLSLFKELEYHHALYLKRLSVFALRKMNLGGNSKKDV